MRALRAGVALLLLLCACIPPAVQAASTLVADGHALYVASNGLGLSPAQNSCASCHFANAPPDVTQGEGAGSQHGLAANFAGRILSAFSAGGVMTGYLGTTPLNPANATFQDRAFKLSLYVGQYKSPVFKSAADGACADPNLSIRVRSGAAITRNAFGCLVDDGNGGVAKDGASGLVATALSGNTASLAASQDSGVSGGVSTLAYNLTYQSVAGYTGSDSFSIQVVNPAGTATKTLPVTVYGVTSGNSASGSAGTTYTAGTPLYTITSNDPLASFGASRVSPAAALSTLGLSVDGSGHIVGTVTGAPGTYTLRVLANVQDATVGAGNGGAVAKDVTLTIAGVTSSATLNLVQNQAMAAYQITTAPSATGGSYTISPSPIGNTIAGLSFDAATGQISGTPAVSGSFQFNIGATTSSPSFVVAKQLTINVASAGAPVIGTTPALPAAPIVAGVVGTPFPATQINASNPPITAGSYTASGLPAGLVVNPNTGQITGTPTASGDFAVTLGASNASGAGLQSITIRISPSSVPSITSAATASATAGSAFAGYQITASNGPIISYAVVAPSVLPAGLTLDPASGLISGTPSASGVFDVALVAGNVAGSSPPFSLRFTISPNTVPAIGSPTFANLLAGVAISPLHIVASNPPILGFAATGLPPGLTVDANSGVIAGTPTSPGTYAATLTATNAVGAGSRLVTFTIGVPAPVACTMSVPLNTSVTLDLATCLFNGFAPTGASIVTTPAHGATLISGTRVTYTPVHNYFGTDAFSFVGHGAGGNSPQGFVSVTITGRPDPAQDPVVTALVAAQTETAQRFSRAQMSNFQRRMESLHRSSSDDVAVAAQATPAAPPRGFATAAAPPPTALASSARAPGALGALPANASLGRTRAAASAFDASAAASDQLSAAQAADVLANGLGIKSLPFSDNVLSLVKDRSLNLAGIASGLGLNRAGTAAGSTGFWVEGVANFGTRDADGGLGAAEFSSDGVSVGADRRIGEQLVLGMGLGYARDTTRIGSDGSRSRARGYSLAVYGSYQPGGNAFVDALLGFGTLDFDTRRFVQPIGAYALGQRNGTQWFGSVTAGYEFRDQSFLWSPYGRLDLSSNRLDNSSENGVGAFALTYFAQRSNSVQGVLGVRSETVRATDFGYVVPRVRAEYLHEFQGSGQAFIGYADQLGGPRYALAASGKGRDSIVLGLGSDFLLRNGLTLSFEYQLSHSFSNDSSYGLRLRLTKEFDAQGLPMMLRDYPVRIGKPLDVQVEAGYTYDDNVTRAKAGPDTRHDDSYSVNVSKTIASNLSERSRILLTGTLGGEKFHHYNGLSRVSGSAEAEYQYRASSDFGEPTFGIFGKLTGEGYESSLRDGYRLAAGVSVRQALTDRINLFGALSRNIRNANSAVFSTRENALRGNLDYAVNDAQTLYLGGEYRRGSIVSTGRPSLENVTIAKVFAQDDAFRGGQLFSYRFDGRTFMTTLGYNIALGSGDSIDFSWRHVRSTPGLRPSFVTTPRNYVDNQLSAVYLMRF